MNDPALISQLQALVEARRAAIEALGITVAFVEGPVDRQPFAAWLDLDSPVGTAQLIAWSDGQANASFQDYAQAVEPLVEYIEDIRHAGAGPVVQRLVDMLTSSSDTVP